MNSPVTCNLIDNALDYLILAGEQADQNSERMLKHSIATLGDGLELLLKARLEIEDWQLLFSDTKKADQAKFESGDFKSVGCEQAIERLETTCSVNVDKKQQSDLKKIRDLRNKVRHFAIETNRQEIISYLAKGYSFAIDFTAKHLETHYGREIEKDLNEIRRMLGEYDAFVKARFIEIDTVLKSQDYSFHIECPKCTQITLYSDGGTVSCAFCGYNKDSEQAVRDWIQYKYNPTYKDMASNEYAYDCPECGSWALVYDENHDCYVCLSCGETATQNKCAICGAPTFGEFCDYHLNPDISD